MPMDTIERENLGNDFRDLSKLADEIVGRQVTLRQSGQQTRRFKVDRATRHGNHMSIETDWQAVGNGVEGNPWRLWTDKPMTIRGIPLLEDGIRTRRNRDGSLTLILWRTHRELTILTKDTPELEKPAGPALSRR